MSLTNLLDTVLNHHIISKQAVSIYVQCQTAGILWREIWGQLGPVGIVTVLQSKGQGFDPQTL